MSSMSKLELSELDKLRLQVSQLKLELIDAQKQELAGERERLVGALFEQYGCSGDEYLLNVDRGLFVPRTLVSGPTDRKE